MTGIDDSAVGHALRDGEPPPAPSPAPPGAVVPTARLTRRGRLRKWDRPPPPHDWRWWISHVGGVMVAAGLLMFGFVAYQLWGTGIETARAQRSLARDFEALLEAAPAVDLERAVELPATTTPPAPIGAPAEPEAEPAPASDGEVPAPEPTAVLPVEAQNLPAFATGDAISRLEIPVIGVDDIVVAGVTTNVLKKGPGHFPGTPLPGQLGNAAIAGHRTTFGQPFFDVDKLVPGDEIVVTTLTGTYVYRVTGQAIVPPSAGHVVATTDPTKATLTLTSCDPKWTARDRIVIYSELDPDASSIVGEPVLGYAPPEAPDPTVSAAPTPDTSSATTTGGDGATTDAAGSDAADATDAPPAGSGNQPPAIELVAPASTAAAADAFGEGWFDDPAAYPHVAFWGVLLALISSSAYLLSRRLRRDWVGAVAGIVPFTVALYFFFQNVNRLLPPNL